MRALPPLILAAAAAGCSDSAPAPVPTREAVTAILPVPPADAPREPAADAEPPHPVAPRLPAEPPLPPAAALDAAGLTVLGGGDFTLVTDAPDAAAGLPPLLAQARPAWDAYFGPFAPGTGEAVPMTAFLMAEPDRFRAAGLLPDDLPPFLTGRQRGRRFWMYEPSEAYFRRSLALHEATHVRMTASMPRGAKGPLWYLEGVAELFGAHRLGDDGTLEVRVIPGEEAAAGGWDRVERVRADAAAGFVPTIEEVRRFTDADFLEGRGYAWAWALCALLDGHPAYRDRFRVLHDPGVRGRLDEAFDDAFAADRRRLEAEWRLFAAELTGGSDLAANAVIFGDGTPLTGPRAVTIDAAGGWRSAGVALAAGEAVDLSANGRFTLADEPKPWVSTADGISFDYHRGHRLGQLQAAVLADGSGPAVGLADPAATGASGRFVAPRAGVLYLRLNDRPDRRRDNRGHVTVTVAPAAEPPSS